MTGAEKVLVVGGSGGIGSAVAKALLARGGKVVVSGRRPKNLEELVLDHPGRAWPLRCDLTHEDARKQLLPRAAELLEGLDGLVFAAGVVSPELPGEISEEALRSQLEINLVAPLRLTEQALSILPKGGSVVLLSSNLAKRPLATHAVYAAAKAGLLAAMKALALAGAPKGIRVNAVLPGVVETEMMAEALSSRREELLEAHPLGRIGQPEEVAQAVIYLLTQGWTTGSELLLDGGALIRP